MISLKERAVSTSPRKAKIQRLRSGSAPRVLDLFAGCGGLSLGFVSAGFTPVGAVEIDGLAVQSYAANLHKHASAAVQRIHATARDIIRTDPDELVEELGFKNRVEKCVDVIVGGPPCQAFARVGRAKLREIAEHPEAFKRDPRADLYLRYLEYVTVLQPLAILIENVPDVLNFGGHNIAEEICEALEERGYDCAYTMLNSAFYGVPQMRLRMFLVAYARELRTTPGFPAPTHWVNLPKGYEGSKSVALKPIPTLFGYTHSYVEPPAPTAGLPSAITVQEAIGDLPKITCHLEGNLRRGARVFDKLFFPYSRTGRLNAYAKLMRSWPDFENVEGVKDHVIRSLPRDYALFARMNHGDQYPEAYQHALEMLNERIEALATQGTVIKEGTAAYRNLKAEIVPPYDPGKFPNKWRKMEPDKPARTLMAHLGKDGYSHIHYDSSQARTISVREAARLQSFPDGFVFRGTMNPAFRQIGNAVPPLLANALAHETLRTLGGAPKIMQLSEQL